MVLLLWGGLEYQFNNNSGQTSKVSSRWKDLKNFVNSGYTGMKNKSAAALKATKDSIDKKWNKVKSITGSTYKKAKDNASYVYKKAETEISHPKTLATAALCGYLLYRDTRYNGANSIVSQIKANGISRALPGTIAKQVITTTADTTNDIGTGVIRSILKTGSGALGIANKCIPTTSVQFDDQAEVIAETTTNVLKREIPNFSKTPQ